jgi:hypothetical protein
MTNKQWEYTIIHTVISAWSNTGNQVDEWLDQLNTLGSNGWEVVSDTVIQAKGTNQTTWPILLLKRESRPVTEQFTLVGNCGTCKGDTVGLTIQNVIDAGGGISEVGRGPLACWNSDCSVFSVAI